MTDNYIERGEAFMATYDVDALLAKLKELIYIVPVPTRWEDHNFENWTDIDDDEELHWQVPTKEILTYILEDMCIDCLWMKDSLYFGDIVVNYDKDLDQPSIDVSAIDHQLAELATMREEWKYDHDVELPKKNYVGNCTKEFCQKIVNRFWEREFDRIQYIDFPPTSFLFATPQKCINEFKHLQENPGSKDMKSFSNLVKYFHTSIWKANVHKSLSPYDGWQLVKSDENAFKAFYANRLRCSDWFKKEGRLDYMLRGVVMENTYGIGLSTSRKYQVVTYFKPRLAKYIIEQYLNEYDTVFDPFSGYSGRMIGALASGKSYIGQDLCETSVKESNEIINFLQPMLNDTQSCEVTVKDSIKSFGTYDCLFTCPPYGDIESWPGVKSTNWTCDKWIDLCLTHYHCKRYVFVVDDSSTIKYKKYVKETLTNTSHFASNQEYIVVIDEDDLKDIKFDISGNRLDTDTKDEFTQLGQDLYNITNQKLFNRYIDAPIGFDDWIQLIAKKFNQEVYIRHDVSLPKVRLNGPKDTVLLACSGGLDSTYQIFQLKEMGYHHVICYHIKNINAYENGQSWKTLEALCDKINVDLIEGELHRSNGDIYDKCWAENPIKNQVILMCMIDYCRKNNICNICMDGSWEFSIDEITAGIDVADAPENYDEFLKAMGYYVENLNFIKTPHLPKIEKIKYLDNIGLMDYVYSCLGPGRMNETRHKKNEEKYGIHLFKHNCGCNCRKCAHHNLLMYYSNYKKYPQEFIDKCWYIMTNNGYNSRNMLFDENLPLEERIKNLYVE